MKYAVFWKNYLFNVHAVFDKFSITEKFTAPFKYLWILMPFGIYHIGCIIRHLKHVSVHGDTQGRIGPTHEFWPFWGYSSYSIIANCTGLILSQVSETFSRFFFIIAQRFFAKTMGSETKRFFRPTLMWPHVVLLVSTEYSSTTWLCMIVQSRQLNQHMASCGAASIDWI